MARYRVTADGINYRPNAQAAETRATQGELVSDLPAKSIKAFLEMGAIEPASKSSKEATDE